MTTTWRINHPTLTMRIAKWCGDLLHRDSPPPLGGWRNDLPEAFFTRKPSLRVRIHNWFVAIYNRQLDGYTD